MKYKNPIPHIGGKKFQIVVTFEFDEYIDEDEAKENVEEYFRRNGLNHDWIYDVTESDPNKGGEK